MHTPLLLPLTQKLPRINEHLFLSLLAAQAHPQPHLHTSWLQTRLTVLWQGTLTPEMHEDQSKSCAFFAYAHANGKESTATSSVAYLSRKNSMFRS